MRKSDIVMRHYDGSLRPVVNVKIRLYGDSWDRAVDKAIALMRRNSCDSATCDDADCRMPADYSAAWIRANLSEDQRRVWYDSAIERAWEVLQAVVATLWPGRSVEAFGRSSGWAGVAGFTDADVASWDAVAVARWAVFARTCWEMCDDLPYQYADQILHNVVLPALEERAEIVREAKAAADLRHMLAETGLAMGAEEASC